MVRTQRSRQVILMGPLVGASILSGLGLLFTTAPASAADKVFVCKYVGKPFVDERLQTGQNPISVSVNALDGPPVLGQFFEDAQGRSVVIAFDTGQPEPSCPQPPPPTTTTTEAPPPPPPSSTTSTTAATTTTSPTTTTLPPTTTSEVPPTTTTTTTTVPGGTTTTQPTTTLPTTTTIEAGLDISALTTVCILDAPFVAITFGDQPQFDGRDAVVTFTTLDGDFVGQEVVTFASGTTVTLIYPGASIDPITGRGTDWPGWMLAPDGVSWIPDPSDAEFRDGLVVTVEVNPSATATITYPPATSACANPPGSGPPPRPGGPAGTTPGSPTFDQLPPAGSDTPWRFGAGLALIGIGVAGIPPMVRRRA